MIETLEWTDLGKYQGGNRLIQNENIKGQDRKTKCFSFEPYAQTLFNLYTDKVHRIIKKDLNPGECIQVMNIFPSFHDGFITIELDGGLHVDIDLGHEKRFIQLFDFNTIVEFTDSIKNPSFVKQFLAQKLYGYVLEGEPNIRVSLWQGYIQTIKDEFMEQIKSPSKAYEALVKECNKGGYFVEVQGVDAFMPGSLAAPNKINDFRTLLGSKVIVMIEDFITEMNSFIVSHKKYIEYILPSKIRELDLNEKFEGTITGTSKYGIFVEFKDFFTGLLHVSKMKEQTAEDFRNRKFKSGEPISFYINEIAKDNRIILTEESPEEKQQKMDSFIKDNENKILDSNVAAIMKFGIIVNVGEISGLIPNSEFKRKKINPTFNYGDIIKVKISEFKDDKIVFKLI